MKEKLLTIGKVATLADTVADTIRFYERKELLAPPKRSKGGYRLYTFAAVDSVRFIRKAVELGFSLKDTRELLALSEKPLSC